MEIPPGLLGQVKARETLGFARSQVEYYAKHALEKLDNGSLHWNDIVIKEGGENIHVSHEFIQLYNDNRTKGFMWTGPPPNTEWLKIADYGNRIENAHEAALAKASGHSSHDQGNPFAGVLLSPGMGAGGVGEDQHNQYGSITDRQGETTSHGEDPAQYWEYMSTLHSFVSTYKEKFEHNLQLLDIHNLNTLSYDQVTRPHEHVVDKHSAEGKLLSGLYELPSARLYGVPSDAELEHHANTRADADLHHANPSTTYSDQTAVLQDLGLTHSEQEAALKVINRQAFLTTLAKHEIPLSTIGEGYVHHGDLHAPDHAHIEQIVRFENGDFSDSDHSTLHSAAELAPAFLHERAAALHELELQTKSANAAALHAALAETISDNALERHQHETPQEHAARLQKLTNERVELESALVRVGSGNTPQKKIVDALNRWINEKLDLSGVPETFLNDFKKQRKIMLERLPETSGLAFPWAREDLDNYTIHHRETSMSFDHIQKEYEAARQTQEQIEGLRRLPVSIDRLPDINQSITKDAFEKALHELKGQLSPANYTAIQNELNKLNESSNDDKYLHSLSTFGIYASGQADPSWLANNQNFGHITQDEAQLFLHLVAVNRTNDLHDLVSGLRNEQVKAAKETLEAGLFNNEPWAKQAERVLSAHASSNGEISDTRLASYLENISKGKISWTRDGLPASFIRLYNDNVQEMSFHKSIDASPIHGVNRALHAEHEHVHAFRNLDHDSEIAVRKIEHDSHGPASEWQYLDAVGAENRVLSDMPLLNRHERELALRSAIQAAYIEMSANGSHSISLGKLESFASNRDTGPTDKTALTLLERVFQHGSKGLNDIDAFEQAIQDGNKGGHSGWTEQSIGASLATHARNLTLDEKRKDPKHTTPNR